MKRSVIVFTILALAWSFVSNGCHADPHDTHVSTSVAALR